MIKLYTNQNNLFLPNSAIWPSNPANLGANLPGGLALSPVPLQLSKFKSRNKLFQKQMSFDFMIGQIASDCQIHTFCQFRAALLVHGKTVEAGFLRGYNMMMWFENLTGGCATSVMRSKNMVLLHLSSVMISSTDTSRRVKPRNTKTEQKLSRLCGLLVPGRYCLLYNYPTI